MRSPSDSAVVNPRGLSAWVHHWGSTPEERLRSYPCDQLQAAPSDVCFRAIDIDAPVPLVFAWLCQLRAAPYSYDLLDNYGKPSPRVRDPKNEQLEKGQTFMRIFRLVEFERDAHLTMVVKGRSSSDALAVTYAVTPRAGGSRLIVKFAFRTSTWSPLRWLLPSGDLFMMQKQLRTLKLLAEHEHASRV